LYTPRKKDTQSIYMSYVIREYTRRRASDLGVQVVPSNISSKKIDVVRDDKVIASVGAKGMGDYATYLETHDKEFAEIKRRLYKQRNERHRTIKNTPGWWGDQLLW